MALEEEEEEEEENPTSDDETFLFEEEEAEEEDIEIREEKELKNVIDEVDATVKTLILRAHVSKIYYNHAFLYSNQESTSSPRVVPLSFVFVRVWMMMISFLVVFG